MRVSRITEVVHSIQRAGRIQGIGDVTQDLVAACLCETVQHAVIAANVNDTRPGGLGESVFSVGRADTARKRSYVRPVRLRSTHKNRSGVDEVTEDGATLSQPFGRENISAIGVVADRCRRDFTAAVAPHVAVPGHARRFIVQAAARARTEVVLLGGSHRRPLERDAIRAVMG